jgi:uncharacterized OB-fold protein
VAYAESELETRPGVVYALTTVYEGPPGITIPYVLAWIDSEEGRLFARVRGGARRGDRGMLRRLSGEGWWFECVP